MGAENPLNIALGFWEAAEFVHCVGAGEPPADVSQGYSPESPGQIISQGQVYKQRYVQSDVYRAEGTCLSCSSMTMKVSSL